VALRLSEKIMGQAKPSESSHYWVVQLPRVRPESSRKMRVHVSAPVITALHRLSSDRLVRGWSTVWIAGLRIDRENFNMFFASCEPAMAFLKAQAQKILKK
jgi:hypothetical protein